jgi:hypothetical protein
MLAEVVDDLLLLVGELGVEGFDGGPHATHALEPEFHHPLGAIELRRHVGRRVFEVEVGARFGEVDADGPERLDEITPGRLLVWGELDEALDAADEAVQALLALLAAEPGKAATRPAVAPAEAVRVGGLVIGEGDRPPSSGPGGMLYQFPLRETHAGDS